MSIVYKMRSDFVLIKVVSLGETKTGIKLPDTAVEGKQYVVVGKGPKVEDLEIGDKVLMVGNQGENWNYLPWTKEYIATKQENVVLSYEDKPEIAT